MAFREETAFPSGVLGPRERALGKQVFRVEQFTEKPSLSKAKEYLASGQYLWNGGIFIWRASTITGLAPLS